MGLRRAAGVHLRVHGRGAGVALHGRLGVLLAGRTPGLAVRAPFWRVGVGPAGRDDGGLRVGAQVRRPGPRVAPGVVVLRRLPGGRVPAHHARGLAPRAQEDAAHVPGVHVRRRRAHRVRAERVGVRRAAVRVRVRPLHGGHVHARPVHGARRQEVARHGERGRLHLLHRRLPVPPGARLHVPRGVVAEHVPVDVRAFALLLRPALLPRPGVAAVAAGARPEAGRHGDAAADRLAQWQQHHVQLLHAARVQHAGGRRGLRRSRGRVLHDAVDVGAAVGATEAGGDHDDRLRRRHGLLRHAAQRRQPGNQHLPERHVQRFG